MKQKKIIMILLAVLAVMLTFLAMWHPWNRKEENPISINGSDEQEKSEIESSNQIDSSENATNQDGSPQGDVNILEDEGEIIIEVPEDQEDDGF